jgi:hypothetical protein
VVVVGNNELAVADDSGLLVVDNSGLLVAGDSNGLPVADNSGDDDDHDVHDVPDRDHGVPNHRHHQRKIEVKTGLQWQLIELKKVIFSWNVSL